VKYLKLAVLLKLLRVPDLPGLLGVILSMWIRRSRLKFHVNQDR